jgi:hypothetical protein
VIARIVPPLQTGITVSRQGELAVKTWCTNVSEVVLRRIGEINACDLAAIGRIQGRDGLPYPFGCTHPHHRHDEGISSVADRLDHGELRVFREWTDAYVAADIWVACRVHQSDPDTEDRRILAYRAGETGYFAAQRNNNVVEVSALSALELGAAIADSVGLTQPGMRARIVIPGYVEIFGRRAATAYDDRDDEGYSVRVAVHRSSQPAHEMVANDQVTSVATIQSRWQPPRRWGVDWTKNFITFIQIDGDGDYIYTPDYSHAIPLTEQLLSERIDRLIAEDIAALRHHGRIER